MGENGDTYGVAESLLFGFGKIIGIVIMNIKNG